jgi:hypothetical protein
MNAQIARYVTLAIVALSLTTLKADQVRSSGGFFTAGPLSGFGSVGQAYSTQTYTLPSTSSHTGLIYVLFGFPANSGADSDGDGMTDWYEDRFGLGKFNSDDATTNSDEDTFTNLQEFNTGTDPKDTDSFLALGTTSILPNGDYRLNWFGADGRKYKIYKSDSLITPIASWVLVDDTMIGSESALTFDYTPGPEEDIVFFTITAEFLSDTNQP